MNHFPESSLLINASHDSNICVLGDTSLCVMFKYVGNCMKCNVHAVLQSAVRLCLDSCSAFSFVLSNCINDDSLEAQDVALGRGARLEYTLPPTSLFEALFKERELAQTAVC